MSDETWVVTLPKLGESVTEGVIGTFFKNVGDEVEFDDPLFEVSTDKVDTEVPSSYDGVVLEVLAQEGDTVSVGAAIMRIGGKGATVPNRLPSAAHGVAAAGGRSLNDPSAPSVGGSEGPTTESADFSPSATGEVFEITMPKLGESVTEGTIGTWFKAVGDDVAFDDPLFDVSTDKVDSEIPSPYDGKMLDILVNAGETVPVGTVLARIGAPGSQVGRTGGQGNGSGPADVESPRAVDAQTGAAPVAAMAQADGCCRHWCAGSPPSTASTSRRLPERVSVVASGARTSRTRSRPARQRLPLRPPLRQRSQHRPRRHPGRRRPAPTGGTKWCRSAECV